MCEAAKAQSYITTIGTCLATNCSSMACQAPKHLGGGADTGWCWTLIGLSCVRKGSSSYCIGLVPSQSPVWQDSKEHNALREVLKHRARHDLVLPEIPGR